MSKDFEIEVQCGWFVGLAHSLYFTALSLHVSSPLSRDERMKSEVVYSLCCY